MSGWEGGPGVNVLHFSQGTPPITADEMAQECYNELVSLYGNLVNPMITGVSVKLPEQFSVIESTTGELQDVQSVGTLHADLAGLDTGKQLSRATSICARYATDQFTGGRRLIGRSFIGPIGSGQIDVNGNILDAVRANVAVYYTALISGVGPRLAVYHRPTSVAAADGRYGDVVSVSANKLPSNLHSRRS